MSGEHARFESLLKFYPASYRKERGDEIIATLQEAEEVSGITASIGDRLSIATHGLQVRLGLTTETTLGKALDLAATPGLVMGALLGTYLFIWGDLPVMSARFFHPTFGPFLSIGPLFYVVWILGVGAVFEWPQFRRRIASICMVVTITGEIIAKAVHRNPNMWEIALLVSLGLPSVLAPVGLATRRRVWQSLAVALGAVVTFALISPPVQVGSFESVYWNGMYRLSLHMPFVDVLVMAIVVTLQIRHQKEIAAAALILSGPWVAVAALYPFFTPYVSSPRELNMGVLVLWTGALAVIATSGRYRPQHPRFAGMLTVIVLIGGVTAVGAGILSGSSEAPLPVASASYPCRALISPATGEVLSIRCSRVVQPPGAHSSPTTS